jgi:hypothetical protein
MPPLAAFALRASLVVSHRVVKFLAVEGHFASLRGAPLFCFYLSPLRIVRFAVTTTLYSNSQRCIFALLGSSFPPLDSSTRLFTF